MPAGLLNEQIAAGQCMKAIIEIVQLGFIGQVAQPIVELCTDSLGGDDVGEIRELSVELLVALTKACHKAGPACPTGSLTPETKELLRVTLQSGVELLEDVEKDVVASACDELADLLHAIEHWDHVWDVGGPCFVGCMTAWRQFLGRELVCQQGGDMNLDDEDVSAADESLMESFAALLGALADAAGEVMKIRPADESVHFEPAFRPTFPRLLEIVQPGSSSPGMRAAAIGAIAEVLSRVFYHSPPPVVAPYAAGSLKPCVAGLRDPDKLVRSNSLYTLGVLVEVSYGIVPEVLQATPNVAGAAVQALQLPCLTDEDRQIADNAVGVLARVICTVPPQHLMMPQLKGPELCRAFFGSLPIRVDLEELRPAVMCVVFVYSMEELRQFFEPIGAAKALVHALFHPKRHLCVHRIRPELEVRALQCLRSLLDGVPELKQHVVLPPQAAQALGYGA